METWQINISLIPSIAVILTSSNRMALGLTDEINVRLAVNLIKYKPILPLKIKQLKRLSFSIFLLYLSLSLLVVNALLVALSIIPEKFDKLLILISISLFLVAIYFKIIFSFKAYQIRQKQFELFFEEEEQTT